MVFGKYKHKLNIPPLGLLRNFFKLGAVFTEPFQVHGIKSIATSGTFVKANDLQFLTVDHSFVVSVFVNCERIMATRTVDPAIFHCDIKNLSAVWTSDILGTTIVTFSQFDGCN